MAIALAMCLSFSAAAVRLGLRLSGEEQGGLLLLGMAAYLLLAGGAAWAIRFAYRRMKPFRFAVAVVAAYALVQLALVFSGGFRLQWTGDASLLHHHIQMLAERGYSTETLSPMSDSYDYQVWARRAVPFYILIQRMSGDAFPMAVQCFNALVMALAALLTWRLASLLLGTRAAAFALAFHVLMPWRIFSHMDLAHHILGGFYYTLGVWILVEWHRPNRSRLQLAGLTLVAMALMPLMRLEGGIDFVFVGAVGGVILLAWLMGKTSLGQALASGAALLVLPLLATSLCVGPLDTLLDQADQHHYDSGILAWSTRGWSVSTGGQYNGNYEQLDVLTPPGQKKQVLLKLLASQAYYNPTAVAFRQLPTKAAKYFMVGYASGFEEVLKYNRLPTLRSLYIGARTAYLLLILPLAIGGGLLFLTWFRTREGLFFLFPFAVLMIAYVVFGESDPRYSAYVHSYICLAAGAFLAWIRTPSSSPRLRAKTLFSESLRPAISLGLLLASWAAIVFAARPLLKPVVLWDMRQASVLENAPDGLPATLTPFEIHLPPVPNASTWGRIQLSAPPGKAARLTFYILPIAGLSASHGTPIVVRHPTSEGLQEEILALPTRVTLAWGANDPKTFELLSTSSPPPFPVMIGYATLSGNE
jgi:hypothetical protein